MRMKFIYSRIYCYYVYHCLLVNGLKVLKRHPCTHTVSILVTRYITKGINKILSISYGDMCCREELGTKGNCAVIVSKVI